MRVYVEQSIVQKFQLRNLSVLTNKAIGPTEGTDNSYSCLEHLMLRCAKYNFKKFKTALAVVKIILVREPKFNLPGAQATPGRTLQGVKVKCVVSETLVTTVKVGKSLRRRDL